MNGGQGLATVLSTDGDTVIMLTRLNGPPFALNPDLIERADATPDTVVTLVGGTKYVVVESLDELVYRVRDFRAHVIWAAQAFENESGPTRALHVVAAEEPDPGLAGSTTSDTTISDTTSTGASTVVGLHRSRGV